MRSDANGMPNDADKIREDKKREEENIYTHNLNKYIFKNLPNVSKLKDQPTPVQCDKLIEKYGATLVNDKLMAMENKADLLKRYKSAYLTLKNWCEMQTAKA